MKFRKSVVLLISMCLLCMFGLFMTNEIRKMHEDSVKAELIIDGVSVAQEKLEFDGFMVIPGGSDTYTLKLTPVASVYADLIISFREDESKKEQNAPLKNHARVKVLVDGKEVIDGLLADMFEAKPYAQIKQTFEKRPFYIDMIFYLPKDAGNELKNTTVDFDLFVTVENQEIGNWITG